MESSQPNLMAMWSSWNGNIPIPAIPAAPNLPAGFLFQPLNNPCINKSNIYVPPGHVDPRTRFRDRLIPTPTPLQVPPAFGLGSQCQQNFQENLKLLEHNTVAVGNNNNNKSAKKFRSQVFHKSGPAPRLNNSHGKYNRNNRGRYPPTRRTWNDRVNPRHHKSGPNVMRLASPRAPRGPTRPSSSNEHKPDKDPLIIPTYRPPHLLKTPNPLACNPPSDASTNRKPAGTPRALGISKFGVSVLGNQIVDDHTMKTLDHPIQKKQCFSGVSLMELEKDKGDEGIKNDFAAQLDDLVAMAADSGVPSAVKRVLNSFLIYINHESDSGSALQVILSRVIKKDCDPDKGIRLLWIIGYLHLPKYSKDIQNLESLFPAERLARIFRIFLAKITSCVHEEMRSIFKFWKTVMHPDVIAGILTLVSDSGPSSLEYAWLLHQNETK